MKHHQRFRTLAAVVAVGVVAASCGSSDSSGDSNAAPATTANDVASTTAAGGSADTTEDAAETTDSATDGTSPSADGSGDDEGFASLAPPTGAPITIGMVNTEGTPGLDFPEMRTDVDLAVDYLNRHGGMGGRPIVVEHCTSAGSPETSQECAQELAGQGVELVMLGLDLFPGYDTFAASEIPVFGALPILAPDFTADALFLSGGNATTMAAISALVVEHFDADTVAIISADSIAGNSSLQALTDSLDTTGVTYTSVKGGDNETDAGFQGLVREADSTDPDVLVSLYSDAGCIGAMRGRVSMGIDTPTISTAICGSAEVIDVVGDDAIGWSFVGVGGPSDTPDDAVLAELIEPAYGDTPATSLGLGALSINVAMTLARIANGVAADGDEVTGASISQRLASTRDDIDFLNGAPLACGESAAYPSVCSFHFPIGEYVAGGGIETVPGFDSVDVTPFLP